MLLSLSVVAVSVGEAVAKSSCGVAVQRSVRFKFLFTIERALRVYLRANASLLRIEQVGGRGVVGEQPLMYPGCRDFVWHSAGQAGTGNERTYNSTKHEDSRVVSCVCVCRLLGLVMDGLLIFSNKHGETLRVRIPTIRFEE